MLVGRGLPELWHISQRIRRIFREPIEIVSMLSVGNPNYELRRVIFGNSTGSNAILINWISRAVKCSVPGCNVESRQSKDKFDKVRKIVRIVEGEARLREFDRSSNFRSFAINETLNYLSCATCSEQRLLVLLTVPNKHLLPAHPDKR